MPFSLSVVVLAFGRTFSLSRSLALRKFRYIMIYMPVSCVGDHMPMCEFRGLCHRFCFDLRSRSSNTTLCCISDEVLVFTSYTLY